MTETLPTPESRKESYLAKAAGMDVSIPAEPMSREEQYLEAIAEGGGGGGTTYTAGDNITIENNVISATVPEVKQSAGDSVTGVMSQKATTDLVNSLTKPNAGYHNSIYRGEDLTTKYTIEQLSAKVQSGDFSDIYIGDYITKTVKVGSAQDREEDFVVAGIDYFYGTGDTEMTNHHLVLIPKNGFYETMKMNDTNTTTDGYYGSQAHGIASTAYTAGTGGALTSIVADYTTFLESALGATDGTYVFTRNASNKWEYSGTEIGDKLTVYGITYSGTPVEGDTITLTYAKGYLEPYRQAIYTAFGDAHVLKHRVYLSTSTSAGAWHTSRVELMNETMVYGCKIQASHNHGDMGSPIQLPYFGMCPNERIAHKGKGGSRISAWLSSIASGSNFCLVGNNGLALNYAASSAYVVRPYFLFN